MGLLGLLVMEKERRSCLPACYQRPRSEWLKEEVSLGCRSAAVGGDYLDEKSKVERVNLAVADRDSGVEAAR
jgi:hypothetical protein